MSPPGEADFGKRRFGALLVTLIPLADHLTNRGKVVMILFRPLIVESASAFLVITPRAIDRRV